MKNISLELIEQLAKKMNENSLNEITLEKGDEKLTLKKEVKYKNMQDYSGFIMDIFGGEKFDED